MDPRILEITKNEVEGNFSVDSDAAIEIVKAKEDFDAQGNNMLDLKLYTNSSYPSSGSEFSIHANNSGTVFLLGGKSDAILNLSVTFGNDGMRVRATSPDGNPYSCNSCSHFNF